MLHDKKNVTCVIIGDVIIKNPQSNLNTQNHSVKRTIYITYGKPSTKLHDTCENKNRVTSLWLFTTQECYVVAFVFFSRICGRRVRIIRVILDDLLTVCKHFRTDPECVKRLVISISYPYNDYDNIFFSVVLIKEWNTFFAPRHFIHRFTVFTALLNVAKSGK